MSFRNFYPYASRRLLDSIACENAQKGAAVLEISIFQPCRKLNRRFLPCKHLASSSVKILFLNLKTWSHLLIQWSSCLVLQFYTREVPVNKRANSTHVLP